MKTKMTLKNQKGAAAVEFAFILPLLLLFLFGIVEFSILFYNKAMITNASREGARAGIVFAPNRLLEADIKAVVNNYAATHLINFDTSQVLDMDNPPPQHTDSDIGDSDVDDAISNDLINSGESLTVTVKYTYDFLVFPNLAELVGGSFANIQTLEAVTVMRYE
jgi:Flp pilus assembly protein TadG